MNFVGLATAETPSNKESINVEIQNLLRKRISFDVSVGKITCYQDIPCQSSLLPEFYAPRSYKPAWSAEGDLSPQIGAFVRALREADRDGLRPEEYRISTIEALLSSLQGSPPTPEILSDLDLVLTDAFLLYASHQLEGRVNPNSFQNKWYAQGRKENIPRILEKALEPEEMANTLQDLPPQDPGYKALRNALAAYRDIARKGGWPILGGPSLHEQSRKSRVSLLRNRLMLSGDLDSRQQPEGLQELFNGDLKYAVRRFQGRHGLKRDGIFGPQTLAALNIPVETRILQIEAKMERWRWLPRQLGNRYLFVNIANFKLEVRENGSTVLEMPVIVGEPYKQTPVFSAKMQYLVFRPYWNIPTSIAVKEILPEIQKDIRYLSEHHIQVYKKSGKKEARVDPQGINWANVPAEKFPFLLREKPGPENDLGLVKFMFPNRFDVYLHDTPARDLFRHRVREFSHGCIRVAKPLDLAEYVLKGNFRWNREEISRAMRAGRDNHTINLPEPITVHILYWTAWVDKAGHLQFRNDVYGRD